MRTCYFVLFGVQIMASVTRIWNRKDRYGSTLKPFPGCLPKLALNQTESEWVLTLAECGVPPRFAMGSTSTL